MIRQPKAFCWLVALRYDDEDDDDDDDAFLAWVYSTYMGIFYLSDLWWMLLWNKEVLLYDHERSF